MKKLITILTVFILVACSPEEYNEQPTTRVETHLSHAEVPNHIIGEWKTIEGVDQKNR